MAASAATPAARIIGSTPSADSSASPGRVWSRVALPAGALPTMSARHALISMLNAGRSGTTRGSGGDGGSGSGGSGNGGGYEKEDEGEDEEKRRVCANFA